MKLFLVITLFSTITQAQQFVNGYVNNRGTYVQPYMKTQPDGYQYNNYQYQADQMRQQEAQSRRLNQMINGHNSGNSGLY